MVDGWLVGMNERTQRRGEIDIYVSLTEYFSFSSQFAINIRLCVYCRLTKVLAK